MGNVAVLVLMIAAFGLTTGRKMFRKCTFCRYYFDTGRTPYELLWTLKGEISSYLTEDQIITLLLDEDDLLKAELVFDMYCEKTCIKNSAPASAEAAADVSQGSQNATEAFIVPCNGSATLGLNCRICSDGSKSGALVSNLKIDLFAGQATIGVTVSADGSPNQSFKGGNETPREKSESIPERLAAGAHMQNREKLREMRKASSSASANEGESILGLAGVLSYSDEYLLRNTSESYGRTEKAGPAEVAAETLNDGSDANTNKSEGLSSRGVKHPDKGDAVGANSKTRTDCSNPSCSDLTS